MVNALENSELRNQAKCLVRKFNNPLDKSTVNDKFECYVDRNKTVRQFIHIVAQYYNLDVDSFYLTFSSFKSDFVSETMIEDKVLVTKTYGLFFSSDVLIYY